MNDELIRKHEGHVTHLTLNRPHKANALSASLVEALLNAVEYAYTDGTRLLILDGTGANFCAGFDFTGYHEAAEGDLVLRFIRIETLLQEIHHAPFATLVFAHGRNFGAGADLGCACGVRVAAPGTTFRLPGLRFGVVLGTRRLAHRVGADAARNILSASRAFDADEAFAMNFVTRVAPQAEWPQIIAEARANCELLTPAAAAALHRQTVIDTRTEDMAALAQSVSVPGFKERIRLFRESNK
ncbi:MAG: enoyl-CoA hydratase/isomerase family protein [Betaproteobacteria bacterium]|nr:enoyl-CoA hydratase/isomerase family protein [Betaproteobacteria bacterium]MBI3937328.1 enoyl-CoA hydratase/isomerase family protein [Betaproteobacteria bacterium]